LENIAKNTEVNHNFTGEVRDDLIVFLAHISYFLHPKFEIKNDIFSPNIICINYREDSKKHISFITLDTGRAVCNLTPLTWA
jgi:hypothetical protein